MTGRNGDKVIGQLLRAEIRRGPGSGCADFDPDEASAYIDRALSTIEQKAYEAHLASCHVCRTAIVRLAALDEAGFTYEGFEVSPAPNERVSDLRSPVRRAAFAAFLRPQWMAVAAALLFAVISVPMILTRLGNRMQARGPAADSVANGSLAVVKPAPIAPTDGALHAGSASDVESGSSKRPGGLAAEAAGKPVQPFERRTEASGPSGQPSAEDPNANSSPLGNIGAGGRSGAVATNKVADNGEAAAQPPAADGPAPASVNRAVAQSSPSGNSGEIAVNGARERVAKASPSSKTSPQEADREAEDKKDDSLPRLDPDKALKLTDDSAKTEVSVLRHGSASDESRPQKGKAATIKPEDSVAPPPQSTTDESRARSRSGIAGGPAKEFVSEAKPAETHVNTDAASIPTLISKGERRVEGKKFRLINGVWTDRLFNPNKEMPYITLVRDSDVYKAMIVKNADLGGYLKGFAPTERAIIVYKKIAYMLVPTASSN
jgi:HAMP domain-containing protein